MMTPLQSDFGADMLAAVFPITLFRKASSRLMNHKLILREYRTVFLSKKVYFPISKAHELVTEIGGEIIEVPEDFFPIKPRKVLSLRQLEKKYGIPFPKSINIIGDIALLNYIPDPAYMNKIGQVIMSNYGVRAVFLKTMEIQDPYRIASWRRIAGYGDTFTVHYENGCMFALDVTRTFFNPRMGGERLRVISQVKSNEKVVDMFTGVGTFAIPMAKKCAYTHAIDINPAAIEFAEINMKLNNVPENKLILHNMDAMNAPKELGSFADRIIMNYPERSLKFLHAAISTLKPHGGIIHLYLFSRDKTRNAIIDTAKEKIVKNISHLVKAIKFLNIMASKEVAPRKFLVIIDLLVIKR